LLGLVRRADPDGRYAMAVVSDVGDAGVGSVLAVGRDPTRPGGALAAGLGIDAAEAERLLRAPAPPPTWLTDGTLALDARVPNDGGPTVVTAVMASADGARVEVAFGTGDGRSPAAGARLTGCPASAPCRLIGFRSAGPAMELHELDGRRDCGRPGDVRRYVPMAAGDRIEWGRHHHLAAAGNMMVVNRLDQPRRGRRRPDALSGGRARSRCRWCSPGPRRRATGIGDDRISPVGHDALP
jgi:hypothetical protein